MHCRQKVLLYFYDGSESSTKTIHLLKFLTIKLSKQYSTFGKHSIGKSATAHNLVDIICCHISCVGVSTDYQRHSPVAVSVLSSLLDSIVHHVSGGGMSADSPRLGMATPAVPTGSTL